MITEFKPVINRITVSASNTNKEEKKSINYYTKITVSKSNEDFEKVVSYKDRKGEEYIRI